MENPDHKKSDGGRFPMDLRVLLEPGFFIILLCVVAPYFSLAERRGDKTLLIVSLVLGGIGVVLLFFARLPLYRQRRFLTFGPQHLSGVHRRLYFAAYAFLVPCILLLLAMTVF
jgi:hypothetical protein